MVNAGIVDSLLQYTLFLVLYFRAFQTSRCFTVYEMVHCFCFDSVSHAIFVNLVSVVFSMA